VATGSVTENSLITCPECSLIRHESPTLQFAYVLNAGTVHEGTPFLISLFPPLYMLFLTFFYKIGIYDPDLV
jgi:hypothetical protein